MLRIGKRSLDRSDRSCGGLRLPSRLNGGRIGARRLGGKRFPWLGDGVRGEPVEANSNVDWAFKARGSVNSIFCSTGLGISVLVVVPVWCGILGSTDSLATKGGTGSI